MRKWILRSLVALFCLVLAGIAAFWVLEVYPGRNSHPPLKLAKGTLAIEHARIYTSPQEAPIEDGTLLIKDGLIAAVGWNVEVPPRAQLLQCNGCVVTAGFWNTHVHLSEDKWTRAEWKPAKTLNAQLADMFLSRGFTTVIDLGSNPADTMAIRRRIEKGELDGPYIYTAGTALYPPHGIPFYVRGSVPSWMQMLMPQPSTPDEARHIVVRNLGASADVTKLFTGSWIAPGTVLPMPLDVAREAVAATHAQGRLVFAHPSNLAGTRVAMQAGVDVLAHAPDETAGITPALLTSMAHQNMAMAPTLKMFATTVTVNPAYLDPIYNEVRLFHAAGGTLLFGTDVGYMSDYSTDGEFEALEKCGLDWKDVLAMLTTNPASRMGQLDRKGTLTPGKLADITVLSADPAQSLTNFARVQTVIRSGRVIFSQEETSH